MKTNIAVNERKLLSRFQFRMIFWYLLAFLAFEVVIVGSSYLVLERQVMATAYHDIREEWSQKTTAAVSGLGGDPEDAPSSVAVDTRPEMVVTWVVSEDGHVLDKDVTLARTPGSLQTVFQTLISKSRASSGDVWVKSQLGNVPILAGAHPLYVDNERIGTLVSAYSLDAVARTMQTLLQVDLSFGIGSVLILLPLAYVLSRRSLLPIRSALQRQRNFVNDAAHELRTPLAILRGTLELAGADEDEIGVREAIRESLRETDYLTDLIGNLSTLARLESGTTPLNLATVDMATIARDTVSSIRSIAETKSIALGFSDPDVPVIISGDASRLRQLLMILLDNAIKYTDAGGQVHLALQVHKHGVHITVEDSGIGISEEELPHVFDRFYRSHRAEKFAPGSGIGLAIAAWIVDSHHGKIAISSQLGKGTKLTVSLPTNFHSRRSLFS